jgi:hypothetical protein
MNELLYRVFEKAKAEGRLCRRCGWIITKKNWAKGDLLCAGCSDALKGVNTSPLYWGWQDEPIDKTGEML